METDNILYIQMLGRFSIRNDRHEFVPSVRSLQLGRLLAYIIANKDRGITKEQIVEILWPEEKLNHPGGALRNLVYRCRTEMAKFFSEDLEKQECIQTINNMYYWNDAVPCRIDIFEFEHFIREAEKEKDPECQFEYLKKAYDLYRGEFLPRMAKEEWVIPRSLYYRNMYARCVLRMCQYYQTKGLYDEVIALCDASTVVDLMEEEIHREKIRAYLHKNAVQQAMDYFYAISKLFSQKFGMELSDSMQDIYKEIRERMKHERMDIAGLESILQDDLKTGTFYCSLDIFKYIYQIYYRSSRRSKAMRYLIHLTLEDSRCESMGSFDLKEEITNMHQVISNGLRRSDTFTQSSFSQFAIMIEVETEEGCDAAIRRLMEEYIKVRKHPEVKFQVEKRRIYQKESR